MKALSILVYISATTSLFAVQAKVNKNDKADLISARDQVEVRKAGLHFNRAGRNYLETKNKLDKGQEYEVTMKCKAGSKKKCLLIRLDDLK